MTRESLKQENLDEKKNPEIPDLESPEEIIGAVKYVDEEGHVNTEKGAEEKQTLASERIWASPELRRAETREIMIGKLAKLAEMLGDQEVMESHIKELENNPEGDLETLILEVFQYMKENNLRIVNNPLLEDLWKNEDFLRGALTFSGEWAFREDKSFKSEIPFTQIPAGYAEVLYKVFDSIGFDKKAADELLSAYWTFRGSNLNGAHLNDSHATATYVNVSRMIALENISQGSARLLYNKYGIRHFIRYSPTRLLAQARGEIEGPLMISFAAIGDWNGAFTDLEKELDILEEGSQKAVVVEGGSLIEAGRRIVRVAKENEPIEKLIIFGHGREDAVELNINEPGSTFFTQQQVKDSKGIGRLIERKIFREDARVIFGSCSTGAKGGIAESLSKKAGVRVDAPEKISYGFDTNEQGRVSYRGYKNIEDKEPTSLGLSSYVPKRKKRFGNKRS